MREIPEPIDLEAISKACDKVLAYMRTHRIDEETMTSIAKLCTFLTRIKKDIQWIEDLMEVRKMREEREEK